MTYQTAAADEFFEGLTEVVAHLRQSPDLDSRALPRSDPLIGELVDHYRIESKIGSGGMGTVYLARDTKLERPVALEFLPKHVGPDGRTAERFLLEARAAAALESDWRSWNWSGRGPGRRWVRRRRHCGQG